MNPDATPAGSPHPGRQRLFEVASDAMIVATRDGLFEDVNPAFTSILGWSLEEVRGKPILELVYFGDRESTTAELAKLRRGAAVTFENHYRTRGRGLKRLAWSVRLAEEGFFAVGREVPEVSLVAPRPAGAEGFTEGDLLPNRVAYYGDPHT